jgi:hypothetical protein
MGGLEGTIHREAWKRGFTVPEIHCRGFGGVLWLNLAVRWLICLYRSTTSSQQHLIIESARACIPIEKTKA